MSSKPLKPSSSTRHGTKNAKLKSKPKAVKRPLSLAEKLKRLFNSLCAQVDGGHFANAIKTCDKILRLEPSDQDAAQTKLFLLLQTEQYGAALSLIDSQGDHAFEKAYSLYRLHQEAEVEGLVAEMKKTPSEDERGVIHLEAQLNYRRGSYQKAFDLYNELLDSTEPDTEEHSDILTNLEATQKHLDFIDSGFSRALDALPSSLTSALESVPPPAPPQTSFLAASSSVVIAEEEKKAPAPKKIRPKRVPPGVTPGVTPPPDPERWLKKSERSTFHSSHKKKKGGGGGATQGFVESVSTPSAGGGGSGGGGGKPKGKKKK